MHYIFLYITMIIILIFVYFLLIKESYKNVSCFQQKDIKQDNGFQQW